MSGEGINSEAYDSQGFTASAKAVIRSV
nr:hypothetical protein [Klebsiella pneumoniae]